MTLATELFNPELFTDGPVPPRLSLSFGGRMEVMDSNGLIGLSTDATNVKALDEIGNRIQVVNPSRPAPSFHWPVQVQGPSYQPLTYITFDTRPGIGKLKPFDFTIDMSMGYNARFPLILSRLEWSMYALLSDHFEEIDIPFSPTADWTELVPGLEVLVERTAAEEGEFSYRMKARYDPNTISYLEARDYPPCYTGPKADVPYSWLLSSYPEMIITSVDIVDAEGHSVLGRSSGRRVLEGAFDSFIDEGDQRIVTRQLTGTCAECGNAAFIRHVIAFKPYNQQLRFVLENVPVPTE